jgi:antitoxin VapB
MAAARPCACRPNSACPTKEVFIRQDPQTGEVPLSARPDSWEEWFELCDTIPVEERERFARFLAEVPDPIPETSD